MAVAIDQQVTLLPSNWPSSGSAPASLNNLGTLGAAGNGALSAHSNRPAASMASGMNNNPCIEGGAWYTANYTVQDQPLFWSVVEVVGAMGSGGLKYAIFDTSWQASHTIYDNELDGTSLQYSVPDAIYTNGLQDAGRGNDANGHIQTADQPFLFGRLHGDGSAGKGFSFSDWPFYDDRGVTSAPAVGGTVQFNFLSNDASTAPSPIKWHGGGVWTVSIGAGDSVTDGYDAVTAAFNEALGPVFGRELQGVVGGRKPAGFGFFRF